MTSSYRPTSRAVAAGTAAGLRHLDRAYIAKINAAIADDRPGLAQELAAERDAEHDAGLPDAPAEHPAGDLVAC